MECTVPEAFDVFLELLASSELEEFVYVRHRGPYDLELLPFSDVDTESKAKRDFSQSFRSYKAKYEVNRR